jgi:hypothetical protein
LHLLLASSSTIMPRFAVVVSPVVTIHAANFLRTSTCQGERRCGESTARVLREYYEGSSRVLREYDESTVRVPGENLCSATRQDSILSTQRGVLQHAATGDIGVLQHAATLRCNTLPTHAGPLLVQHAQRAHAEAMQQIIMRRTHPPTHKLTIRSATKRSESPAAYPSTTRGVLREH